MKLPEHKNPGKDRASQAPYNFVPLPETVVKVEPMPPAGKRDEITDGDLAPQDKYYHNRFTGYLACRLTTLTPLYTRCLMTPKQFEQFSADPPVNEGEEAERKRLKQAQEERAPFFHIDDIEEPVIPGSSLRGMVRSLVEMAGYGKIQPVTKRNLFFRTVEVSALGQHYRDRIGNNKVEAGFLRQAGNRYYIMKCTMVRVGYELLGGKDILYVGHTAPNMRPRWSAKNGYYQYQKVWVELDGHQVKTIQPAKDTSGRMQAARLVITGDVPVKQEEKKKKRAFVFLLDEKEEIEVDEKLIRRFQDDDQITPWQEQAFPVHQPDENCRRYNGFLRKDLAGEGDPVFFLRDGQELIFFGRAYMFRLPYQQSPFDFVPKYLRGNESTGSDDIDLAEAIFGFVRDRKTDQPEAQSLAGRVFFTDAHYHSDLNGIWLIGSLATDKANIIRPPILSSPKPTSFQHYLVQKEPHNPDTLKHYDDTTPQNSVIRGHKLYWHRHTSREDITADPQQADEFYRQHTRIQPVKDGVSFGFRLYFENLSRVELGALLWALNLPEGHYHKLGMGKPLGMGSVAIQAGLYLDDREKRYKQLFTDDQTGWVEAVSLQPADAQTEKEFKRAFEKFVLAQLGANVEADLDQQPRIKELLNMLKGTVIPDRFQTAYLAKPEDFKDRRVLPTPQGVIEQAEKDGQLSKGFDPQKVKSALRQEKPRLQYKVGDQVEGQIITSEWPGGEVEVRLTNGEKGLLSIARTSFKRSQNQTLKLRVDQIKRGIYYLKLDR
jgi:CRISPR-associated protein (TIGR03986 family)